MSKKSDKYLARIGRELDLQEQREKKAESLAAPLRNRIWSIERELRRKNGKTEEILTGLAGKIQLDCQELLIFVKDEATQWYSEDKEKFEAGKPLHATLQGKYKGILLTMQDKYLTARVARTDKDVLQYNCDAVLTRYKKEEERILKEIDPPF